MDVAVSSIEGVRPGLAGNRRNNRILNVNYKIEVDQDSLTLNLKDYVGFPFFALLGLLFAAVGVMMIFNVGHINRGSPFVAILVCLFMVFVGQMFVRIDLNTARASTLKIDLAASRVSLLVNYPLWKTVQLSVYLNSPNCQLEARATTYTGSNDLILHGLDLFISKHTSKQHFDGWHYWCLVHQNGGQYAVGIGLDEPTANALAKLLNIYTTQGHKALATLSDTERELLDIRL